MNPINLYSALVFFLIVLAVGVIVALRRGNRWIEWAAVAGFVLLGGLAWAVLRPTQTRQAGSALQGALGQGRPVLLEFQSPY